jgi:hypothetical protein
MKWFFLGGCATCLLLSDPATPPPRVTYDVDVIVEAASLDGRPEIIDEIQLADKDLRSNLSNAFSELLNNRHFTDALPGHLPPDKASQSRLPIILNRIDSISKL